MAGERQKRRRAPLHEERKRLILDKLKRHGQVYVSELARQLGTSEVTIRNDLKTLAERGLLMRSHGGAVTPDSALFDRALGEKERLHAAQKTAIAARAVKYIHEGQSIILDSGSTTTEVARALRHLKNLTIITNALNIALELSESNGIDVILTGGVLRKTSLSLVEHLAEDTLEHLTADVFFLGVDGIHPEVGFTTPNLAESRVNQKMIRTSREVIVVADSSKFGRKSLAVICPPDRVTRIITDSRVDPGYVEAFESLGVQVVTV